MRWLEAAYKMRSFRWRIMTWTLSRQTGTWSFVECCEVIRTSTTLKRHYSYSYSNLPTEWPCTSLSTECPCHNLSSEWPTSPWNMVIWEVCRVRLMKHEVSHSGNKPTRCGHSDDKLWHGHSVDKLQHGHSLNVARWSERWHIERRTLS